MEVSKVYSMDSSAAFGGGDHRRRGRGGDLQGLLPGQGAGSTALPKAKLRCVGSSGAVLRRDEARAVPPGTWTFFLRVPLFWKSLALVFLRQSTRLLELLPRAPCFWQSLPQIRQFTGGCWENFTHFYVKVNSDPEVHDFVELFIWRLAAEFGSFFHTIFRTPSSWTLSPGWGFLGAPRCPTVVGRRGLALHN